MFIPSKSLLPGVDALRWHRKTADYAQTRPVSHRNLGLILVFLWEQYLIELTS
jgi:hypothetical protein